MSVVRRLKRLSSEPRTANAPPVFHLTLFSRFTLSFCWVLRLRKLIAPPSSKCRFNSFHSFQGSAYYSCVLASSLRSCFAKIYSLFVCRYLFIELIRTLVSITWPSFVPSCPQHRVALLVNTGKETGTCSWNSPLLQVSGNGHRSSVCCVRVHRASWESSAVWLSLFYLWVTVK